MIEYLGELRVKRAKTYFERFAKSDWVTFALSVVLFALTLLPMFVDVPSTSGWLRSLLITLGAATLAAIVLSQIGAREADKSLGEEVESLKALVNSAVSVTSVHEVPAGQIRTELEEMLESSKEWYFRGGSARWQRETVLPKLAQVRDRPVQYSIQIISPFEPELCEKYALYRRKSRPNDERADPKQISLELLAFIYAVAVWSSKSKISPSITLLHRFSPFRLDGNLDGFMITVADTSKNGLKTNAGNWYHASLLDEFVFEAGHATRLELPAEAFGSQGVPDIKDFFSKVCFQNPDVTAGWDQPTSDVDWQRILDLAGVERA